jgi:hypothetical protein
MHSHTKRKDGFYAASSPSLKIKDSAYTQAEGRASYFTGAAQRLLANRLSGAAAIFDASVDVSITSTPATRAMWGRGGVTSVSAPEARLNDA